MKISKIFRAGAAAALVVSLCGCSMKFGTKAEPKADYVVAEPQNNAEDSLKVTYGDFKKEYDYALKGAGVEDDTEDTLAEACKTQRNTIITYLINERIILKKAAEMGVSALSDEEMDAIEEEYNSNIGEQIEAFADEEVQEGEELSDEERHERGSKAFDEYLASCGLTRDDLLAWQVNSVITQHLVDELAKDVDYAEAEQMFADYEEQIKQVYSDDVSQYEANSSFTAVWVPEGARMIKHILLGFDEETQDEITADRQKGDDEAADKLREEKAAELQDKVDEVRKKLDGGDFETVMKEYSADAEGSSYYPDGYLVIPNGTSYMKEFQEAAFVPEKIGDRTVCVTDYGVHIMIYADDARVSDENKKSFTDYLYDQLKQAKFSEKMEEWHAEYNYKTDYEALRLDDPSESSGG
ncbi:MAG: peptidylprolyl isomerase [Lachnospiraceae bacterium]|nr:peptidylprolyl isomerase [Ruminococcus sp.]MCM1274236.1 peptidylprolyl isomerase [Lachnospiraceae bacterium]